VGPRIALLLGDEVPDGVDAVVRVATRGTWSRHAEVGTARVVGSTTPPTIEVVAPTFSPAGGREHLLSRSYRAVLAAADSIGATSIAIPTELSRGPWPLEHCIRIALGTLESTPTRVRRVVVTAVTPGALELWAEGLARR
jgi:hypothetical protein